MGASEEQTERRKGARRRGQGRRKWDCLCVPRACVSLRQRRGANGKAYKREKKQSGKRKTKEVKEQDRSVRMFLLLIPLLFFGDHPPSMFQDSPWGQILCFLCSAEEPFVAQVQMLVSTSLVSPMLPWDICANRAVIFPTFLVSEGSDQS